jgi:urease accessory protein
MTKPRHLVVLLLALGFAGAASAHVGTVPHDHASFLDGLVHPFTGADHLAAMLAVGFWSALAVRPAWAAPAAFVTLLVAGAGAAVAGLAVPAVEPMIAASVLVLGLLVATRTGLPLVAAAALTGAFAFFHGAAHGMELAGDGAIAPLAGMVVATAALHAAGIALGRLVRNRQAWIAQACGGAVALLGTSMLMRLA